MKGRENFQSEREKNNDKFDITNENFIRTKRKKKNRSIISRFYIRSLSFKFQKLLYLQNNNFFFLVFLDKPPLFLYSSAGNVRRGKGGILGYLNVAGCDRRLQSKRRSGL